MENPLEDNTHEDLDYVDFTEQEWQDSVDEVRKYYDANKGPHDLAAMKPHIPDYVPTNIVEIKEVLPELLSELSIFARIGSVSTLRFISQLMVILGLQTLASIRHHTAKEEN